MKQRTMKRKLALLLLSLFLPVLLLPAAPFSAAAFADNAEQADSPLEHTDNFYHFSDLPTLRRILALEADEEIWATETEDLEYTLSEDLTVPTGKKLFFGTGTVTVEPGVTVTVEEEASLFFYSLNVRGTVINRGDLVQCSPNEGADDILRIEGSIINSDWMMFYHVEGMEHITNMEGGRLFDASEDENVSDKQSEQTPASNATPSPEGSSSAGIPFKLRLHRFFQRIVWQVRRFFLMHRDDLLSYAAYLIVILIVLLRSAAKRKKRQTRDTEKRQTSGQGVHQGSGQADRQTSGQTIFQNVGPDAKQGAGRAAAGKAASRFGEQQDSVEYSLENDYEKRIANLKGWLKSGLIDQAEYRVLKDRYEREYRNGR